MLSVLTGCSGTRLEAAESMVQFGVVRGGGERRRLEIRSSGFLEGTVEGAGGRLPEPPLPKLEGIPVLFGTPEISRSAAGLRIEADLIASAYFLLTRHEEIARRDVRDGHGRFPGKESLPVRAGFIDRPIVDEMGRLLRRCLREVGFAIEEPPEAVRKVYLTHDVDIPFRWHRMRPALRETARRMVKGPIRSAAVPLLSYIGLPRTDPNDCFDWIIEQDQRVVDGLGAERVRVIHFMMAGGTTPQDGMYEVGCRHVRCLLHRLKESGAEIGLHPSYEAGLRPELVVSEAANLQKVHRGALTSSRHHYLTCREPEHFAGLARAGIKHDFTMTYADVAGFRLGTSRSFRWFDPAKCELTQLEVHPTTVMECTLDRGDYMGLRFDEALDYCKGLIQETRRHHGDLTLLWHNTELTEAAEASGGYHRRLYGALLDYVCAHANDAPRQQSTRENLEE